MAPESVGAALTERKRNALLDALPTETYRDIAPLLQAASVERGVVLHRPGEDIVDLYFPLDCLISVTVTMRDGRTAETGVVGSREMVGLNAFMGGRETTQTEFVVQIAGDVLRMPAAPLRAWFDRDATVRAVLLKFTQAMFAQVTQNAACNSLHGLEQRFARWLLESRDRIGSDHIELTHAFISEMLGVRRAGVADLSRVFEKRGAIEHQRGRIQITDSAQLETASCECYAVLALEYQRLLEPRR